MTAQDLTPGLIFRAADSEHWQMVLTCSLIEPWEAIPEKFHGQYSISLIANGKKKHRFLDADMEVEIQEPLPTTQTQ